MDDLDNRLKVEAKYDGIGGEEVIKYLTFVGCDRKRIRGIKSRMRSIFLNFCPLNGKKLL